MMKTKSINMRAAIITLAVLCAAMFTVALAFETTADAATAFSLTPAKKVLNAGKTVTIKARGMSKAKLKKVRWSTSDKTIAVISRKKGRSVKVSAKAAGEAVITGKYGKKKSKATITVKQPLKSVSIAGLTDGTATAGQKLTAVTAPADATAAYQWVKSDGADITLIGGATDSSYTLTPEDAGYTVSVEAAGTGYYTGTVHADFTTADINGALSIAEVKLTDNKPVVGEALGARLFDADGNKIDSDDAFYTWYADGQAIEYQDHDCYITLTAAEKGKRIACRAIGMGKCTGSIKMSDATQAVEENTDEWSADIENDDGYSIAYTYGGAMLHADADQAASNNFFTFQWYKNGNLIEDATNSTYAVPDSAAGSTYKVEITPKAGEGYGTDPKEASVRICARTSRGSISLNNKAPTTADTVTATVKNADGNVLDPARDVVVMWCLDDNSDYDNVICDAAGNPIVGASFDINDAKGFYNTDGKAITLKGHKLAPAVIGGYTYYLTEAASGAAYADSIYGGYLLGTESTAAITEKIGVDLTCRKGAGEEAKSIAAPHVGDYYVDAAITPAEARDSVTYEWYCSYMDWQGKYVRDKLYYGTDYSAASMEEDGYYATVTPVADSSIHLMLGSKTEGLCDSEGNVVDPIGEPVICVVKGKAGTAYEGASAEGQTGKVMHTIQSVEISEDTLQAGRIPKVTIEEDNGTTGTLWHYMTFGYVSVKWYVGNVEVIADEYGRYVPTAADVGKTLKVEVTGIDDCDGTAVYTTTGTVKAEE